MRHLSRLAIVLASSLGLAAGASAAQHKPAPHKPKPKESKVAMPAAVEKAFKAAYPGAVVKATLKETKDGQTVFEIESVDKGLTRDLLYTGDGTVLEIEEQLLDEDVPPAVTAAIKARYPKARLTKREKLTKGQTVEYEFRATGAGVKELVLNPDGSWVKPAPSATKR